MPTLKELYEKCDCPVCKIVRTLPEPEIQRYEDVYWDRLIGSETEEQSIDVAMAILREMGVAELAGGEE